MPLDGGATIRLNPELPPDAQVQWFRIAPNSEYVVYIADQNTPGRHELFRVPIGGGPTIRLNATMVSEGDVVDFSISPDGSRVIYRADQNVDEQYDIFTTLSSGGGTIRLNRELVAGGDVEQFAISANNQRVVYLADQNSDDVQELFSAPLTGGTVIPLSAAAVDGPDEDVANFQISPDGSRVVYRADWEFDNRTALRSVLIGGGGDVGLNPTPLGGTSGSFVIGGDPARVLFLADPGSSGVSELFSAPLDGSAAPQLLSDGPTAGSFIIEVQLTADGQQAVFRTGISRYDLYAVPADGAGDPILLSQPVSPFYGVVDYQISDTSNQVVYTLVAAPNTPTELFSVSISGGNQERLNRDFPVGGNVQEFLIAAGSGRVIYRADQDSDGVAELYSVLLSGGLPTKLNGVLATFGDVNSFVISPDGAQTIYLADQDTNGLFQIYGVATSGGTATALSTSQAIGGDVNRISITPDGATAIYLAAQETPGQSELYAASLGVSGLPRKLNGDLGGGGNVFDYQISPNSAWVVYRADQDTDEVSELYSVRLDDGLINRLNMPLPLGGNVFDYAISPDSSRVLYRADQNRDEVFELYSVPITGSGVPVRLNSDLPPNGNVSFTFAISPDSRRVVYLADQQSDEVHELFSVAIDGGTPTKLNSTLIGDGDVQRFSISPSDDNIRVVYLADQQTNNIPELYSVPINGGSAIRLNPPLSAPYFVDSSFVIDPSGSRVVYLAAQERSGVLELFSVPISGGSVARLNVPPPTNGDILSFAISPDPSVPQVIYQGDQDRNDMIELFRAPLDGSSDPVKLNGELPPGGSVSLNAFAISPDGRWVVYQADQDAGGVVELFSAPLDGSGASIKLNGPFSGEGDIEFDGFRISPDSRLVVYRADQRIDGRVELFRVPISGGIAVRVNGDLPQSGDVFTAEIAAGSDQVVYRADQEQNEVIEAFAADLSDAVPQVGFSPAPTVVREDAGSMTVRVGLSADISTAISVNVTPGGSATAGVDYNLERTVLTIPAGATGIDLTLTIIDDTLLEGSETIELTLNDISGADLGANRTLTISILDDDAVAQIYLPSLAE
ncbi:MAG: hypothetical protein HC822_18710 [Oscillochloris sp.]|nr:hypothetical protein [Oscillochloris sp.]